MDVTIYFVDIEPADETFYGECFAEHQLISVRKLAEVGEDAEIASVFIDEPIDEAFLAAHPKLRLVATRSTSVDHIDVAACARRHIPVCHVANYGGVTVAEHTFALMLSLARRLRELMNLPRGGRFSYEATRGFDLHGKTLGLIGMGWIGRNVATLARAFQMEVIAHDIDMPPELAQQLQFQWVSLDDLLERSDVISLHSALTPQTYHLVNARTLAQMKRGVLIINTARGALIDTSALRSALESGHVGGAGLDVLQDERVLRHRADEVIADDIVRHLRSDALASEARDADRIQELKELMLGDDILSRTNVVFTPHVAFNTHEAVRRMADLHAQNIQAFLDGQPRNLVSAS
jgi:D-lactate dehydrogenase